MPRIRVSSFSQNHSQQLLSSHQRNIHRKPKISVAALRAATYNPSLGREYKSIAARLTGLHSYEVPEIIALPAIAVEQNYLLWAKSALI